LKNNPLQPELCKRAQKQTNKAGGLTRKMGSQGRQAKKASGLTRQAGSQERQADKQGG
jgi:hypothetical protein